MDRRDWLKAAGVCGILPVLSQAQTPSFPSRPIKVVVPLGPGSSGDATMRFIAEGFRAVLGLSLVIENFPGGNGAIAAAAVKRAPADGYTILQGSTAMISLNPVITKNLAYDPLVDFRPIHGMSKGVNMIITGFDSKYGTFQDMIDDARKAARPLSVGTFSPQYQLAAAWLASTTKAKFNNIPYKGASLMLNDLMGKSLDIAFSDVLSATPFVASGKVRVLAVSGDSRHPKYPNVPTVRESGFEEFVNYSWSSLYARTEVSDSVVNLLAQSMRAVLEQAETRRFFASSGSEPLLYGPREMRNFQFSERQRFERIATLAGIQPQ